MRLNGVLTHQETIISTSTTQTARATHARLPFAKSKSAIAAKERLATKLNKKSTKRRLVRYGLIGGNVAILVGVLSFIAIAPNPASTKPVAANSVAAASDSSIANPLDQLSAADIAVNVARMDQLPEATAVTNQADSVNADLAIAPEGDSIASKPQVVSTALTSRADIKKYVTVAGDTIASVAAKFNVTSDSVRWSNSLSLSTTTLNANQTLTIPPVNGIVYIVASGDTPASLAQKFRASQDRIIAANDAEITGIKPGEEILIPDGTEQAAVATVASSASYGGLAWGGTAIYGSNGYDYGYCTWYVANRRAELGHPVPSNLGNAYSWYRAAVAAGLPTGFTPQVGAVMVNEGGNHVAVVEQVNPDGSFWISEMNSYGQVSITNPTKTGGWGVRDYKLEPGPGIFKFIY